MPSFSSPIVAYLGETVYRNHAKINVCYCFSMVILLKTKWLIFSRFVKLLIENKSNQGNEELQANNNNINQKSLLALEPTTKLNISAVLENSVKTLIFSTCLFK